MYKQIGVQSKRLTLDQLVYARLVLKSTGRKPKSPRAQPLLRDTPAVPEPPPEFPVPITSEETQKAIEDPYSGTMGAAPGCGNWRETKIAPPKKDKKKKDTAPKV